jgi:uncharacterized FAD-dependent dehydrogenase
MDPRFLPQSWRVRGLELPVDAAPGELAELVTRELGLEPGVLRAFRLVRRSLDARRKAGAHQLRFVHQVEIALDRGFRGERFARAVRSGRVLQAPPAEFVFPDGPHASLRGARVALLGAGPGGLFAAWMLARSGVAVEVYERGSPVERRGRELVAFQRTRVPNPESNLLFGEGGAGTYSDGKLYTRVEDALELPILEELVACGASSEILFDARAHVGTDKLHRVLPRLRARLEQLGVRFHWNTRVEGLVVAGTAPNSAVRALRTSRGEAPCDALVFATGHSARDTWDWLAAAGVELEAKPFQLGLRIEHPQELVDRAQLGGGALAACVAPSYYQLVSRAEQGAASSFSFCMCPGGRIVASVNEPGYLCTNGMSNSKHSSRYANAALVVTLDPRAQGGGPLAGVERQRALERRFFEAGGSDYSAPAQRASDFLARRESRGALVSSYRFGCVPGRLDLLLDEPLRAALALALARFERTIPGFSGDQGLFVGLESRSSGPVRAPRERETLRARGFANLYPVGEGAGWAGGIMSAAIDGARAARALLVHGLARPAGPG